MEDPNGVADGANSDSDSGKENVGGNGVSYVVDDLSKLKISNENSGQTDDVSATKGVNTERTNGKQRSRRNHGPTLDIPRDEGQELVGLVKRYSSKNGPAWFMFGGRNPSLI